jgi:hypothetical protein
MATFEPTFVSVLGGSVRERAALVQGLIGSLRARGVTATSLPTGSEGVGAARACGSASRGAKQERPPFWEMAIVFVEGFATSTIPRIVLAGRGEPLPGRALRGVISVVDPAALEARPELVSAVLGGVADRLCARRSGGVRGRRPSDLETHRTHEVEGVALRDHARP